MATEKKYIISFLATVKGNKLVVKQFKQMQKAIKDTTKPIKPGIRKTNDFIKALKRAAIVAPVWLALRAAMMGVIRTINLGVKYWVELESAIARAAAVTRTETMSMGNAMNTLKKVAEDFAIAHKGTAKDVIEAFYRMGTSGLAFEDAIMGAIPAVKLAVGTYGDVATTAKTVSAIYRLMGDSITGATTKQEKMTKIADVLALAWSEHEVEIGELSQAIANAGTQATSFGLTMTELIAVLATSHDALLKGGRAGRLFSRSLDDLSKKLPEVEKLLGAAFDPKKALNWFQVFRQILVKFKDVGTLTPEIEKQLSSIFGIRSRRAVRALIVQFDKLDLTLSRLENNSKGTADALLAIRDATPEAQLENLRENFSKLVADFITGVTSSEDFVTALQKINTNLEEMSLTVITTGAGLSQFAKNIRVLWRLIVVGGKAAIGTFEQLQQIISEQTPLGQLDKQIKKIFGEYTSQYDKAKKGQEEFFKSLDKAAEGGGDVFEAITKATEDWIERQSTGLDSISQKRNKQLKEIQNTIKAQREVSSEIEMQLKLADNLVRYKELELASYDKVKISYQKIMDFVESVADNLRNQNIEVNKQELLSNILKKNWGAVLDITKEHVIKKENLVKLDKMVNQIILDQLELQKSISKAILSHELELLKMRGATQKTILEATAALEDQFGINQGTLNQLNRQLSLEKEITAEKLGQRELSSDSLKIFEAYQRYGIKVAKEFAEVIAGTKDLEDLSRVGRRAVKRLAPERLEQEAARKFFFEEKGRGLAIPERTQLDLVNSIKRYTRTILESDILTASQRAAITPQIGGLPPEREVRAQITQDIAVTFPEINIKAEIPNIAQKATDAVIEELQKEDSPLSREIEKKIDEF